MAIVVVLGVALIIAIVLFIRHRRQKQLERADIRSRGLAKQHDTTAILDDDDDLPQFQFVCCSACLLRFMWLCGSPEPAPLVDRSAFLQWVRLLHKPYSFWDENAPHSVTIALYSYNLPIL